MLTVLLRNRYCHPLLVGAHWLSHFGQHPLPGFIESENMYLGWSSNFTFRHLPLRDASTHQQKDIDRDALFRISETEKKPQMPITEYIMPVQSGVCIWWVSTEQWQEQKFMYLFTGQGEEREGQKDLKIHHCVKNLEDSQKLTQSGSKTKT